MLSSLKLDLPGAKDFKKSTLLFFIFAFYVQSLYPLHADTLQTQGENGAIFNNNDKKKKN